MANEANEQRLAATQEKALANKAYKQRWAATQEKILPGKVNKQCHQVTATQENALANNAFERRYQESAKRAAALAQLALAAERAAVSTDLALPPMALSPPPHHPTTHKDAVLSTMRGSLCAKSLVVAPLSCPSTMVDGHLQMACRRSQPCCHVGHCHGPRAPHPQEHFLCNLQLATSAPCSQPIYCEWMGLSGGGGFCCFWFFWRHLGDFVASCSFGGTWGILLLPGSFGSTFWETIFLVKGYLLFVFLSFGSFG